MELQQIDVFIDKHGQVRIEVRGVAAGRCLDLTRELETALGGQITQRQMTHEALGESIPLGDRERLRGG